MSEVTPKDEAERQLWLAKQATPEEQADHLLTALTIFYDREDYDNSLDVIRQLQRTPLSTLQHQQFAVLAGAIALELDKPWATLSILSKTPPGTFAEASPEVQTRIIDLQATALYRNGAPLQSAQERVFNAGLFTGQEYWENHEQIWQALNEVSSPNLSEALQKASDYSWQGWLELALQINQYQLSLDKQLKALSMWQADWPEHEAARRLPAELEMLSNLPELRPGKIALVLPLTGNFGKVGRVIRDGFLAAYYADDQASAATTEINVFDSEDYPNALDLYLELQLEGYDLFVGPLKKASVNEFTQLPLLDPPVLALNYQEQEEAIDGFFQFGLSVEDEVQQLLDLFDSQQKQNIAIIHQDAAWAVKLVDNIKMWSKQKSYTEPITFSFNASDNLSNGIADFLEIDESIARANKIKTLVGEAESQPRRRQDIDAVVILSPPIKARQIKPLLAFHYASNIPLFAVSRIYSGIPRPNKDHDLDGITYTEIPWMLNKTSPLKKDIEYIAGTNLYEKFYALGADTYLLAPRLELLKSFPDSKIQGNTGSLTINPHLQIRRTLEWATFEQGLVKAQPDLLQ